MTSSNVASDVFRNKEGLLLRRSLPVEQDSPSSSTVASRSGTEWRTPSTASTAVPLYNERREQHGNTTESELHYQSKSKGARERAHKNINEHVAIPRLEYYDNLRRDEVNRGSTAQLHLSPYGQRNRATRSCRQGPFSSLPSVQKEPHAEEARKHNMAGHEHRYLSSDVTVDTFAKIAPRAQGCPVASRLLPAGTPYLAESCGLCSSEQGVYHNIYYNTTYKIPDKSLSYSQREKRKWANVSQPNTKSAISSARISEGASGVNECTQLVTSCECCANRRTEERAKLSWHLMDRFFPDFGHQCLSDEDLVRDLAERLRSLVEQQEPSTSDNAKDLLTTHTRLHYPIIDIPDAGHLFGLGDADGWGLTTALQDASTAAAVEMATLNDGYERVNAETGLVYDPIILQPTPDFVRVYNQPSLAPQRFFISNGCFMDVIPMLRFQSSGVLIPEKFIFSHGSFLRLTAAILLSRFPHLYQIREVLLEGTGHVFPLFPVVDISQSHAPRELDALIKWSVRSTLEERLVEDFEMSQKHRLDNLQKPPEAMCSAVSDSQKGSGNGEVGSPEEYCVQLYDCNNFDCLPIALWLGHTRGTFQDHVVRCLEDSLDNPSGEERFFRQQQSDGDAIRQRLLASRRRLFLGVVPSRETGGFYRLASKKNLSPTENLLLEDTLSLAYGYFYTAQHYSITGSDGSMVYNVLCGRLPEVALYDCLIMVEKLRLALRHSHLHPTARKGLRINSDYEVVQEQYQRDLEVHKQKSGRPKHGSSVESLRCAKENSHASTCKPVLWRSDVLLEQYAPETNESNRTEMEMDSPTFHSVAVMLFEFFPGKKLMDLELLCRAVVQDTMRLGGLFRTIRSEEEFSRSTKQNDLLFINEVARAMMAVVLEQDALRRYRSQSRGLSDNSVNPTLPPPPPLVFDDKIGAILRTKVPVDTLFQYHSSFFDHDGEMWRKSNLVECLRMLYTADVFQYASDMQVAILSAECRGYQQIPPEWLAVEPYPYRWPPELQRSFLRLRHLPIKFSTPTTGVASVRAVLEAVQRADPLKSPMETKEYVHHLLILYFRDHVFPPLHPQYPGNRKSNMPMHPNELIDAVTLMNWFDGAPTLSLCDTVYVDLYALAALCPLVLGRRLVVYAGDSLSETVPDNKAVDYTASISSSSCRTKLQTTNLSR